MGLGLPYTQFYEYLDLVQIVFDDDDIECSTAYDGYCTLPKLCTNYFDKLENYLFQVFFN